MKNENENKLFGWGDLVPVACCVGAVALLFVAVAGEITKDTLFGDVDGEKTAREVVGAVEQDPQWAAWTNGNSISLGEMANAEKKCLAIGGRNWFVVDRLYNYATLAKGEYAVAIGFGSKAFGNSSTALGSAAYATNKFAVAIGGLAEASNKCSVAIGTGFGTKNVNLAKGAETRGDGTFCIATESPEKFFFNSLPGEKAYSLASYIDTYRYNISSIDLGIVTNLDWRGRISSMTTNKVSGLDRTIYNCVKRNPFGVNIVLPALKTYCQDFIMRLVVSDESGSQIDGITSPVKFDLEWQTGDLRETGSLKGTNYVTFTQVGTNLWSVSHVSANRGK